MIYRIIVINGEKEENHICVSGNKKLIKLKVKELEETNQKVVWKKISSF